MARANLRGLIGNLGETEPVEPGPSPAAIAKADEVIPEAQTEVSPDSSRSADRARPTPQAATSAPPTTALETQADAHFTSFQRKETRLRADQQNALTEHARRLNRAKGTGGQRITDNTLIRVAVDLLLSRTDKLTGRDESELRRSLGMKAG
jgi:outer membrane protein OmpA-like peptidoglycan-associated protein